MAARPAHSDGLIIPREVDPAWIENSEIGDRLTITILRQDGSQEVIDAFGPLTNEDGNASREVPLFQGLYLTPGTPLHAVGFGVGKYRSTPDYRRFVAIAATVLEAGDPVSFARYYAKTPFDVGAYDPDAIPGTATLVIMTVGDMNVPVNTGVAMATAGHILSLSEEAELHTQAQPGSGACGRFCARGVAHAPLDRRRGREPTRLDRETSNRIKFDADDMDEEAAPERARLWRAGALCAASSITCAVARAR